MIEDQLRDLMASMASEMPPPEGPPPRMVRRARRRSVVVLSVALAVVLVTTGGVFLGARALTRDRAHRIPVGPPPPPTPLEEPTTERILFVRESRDGSAGSTADDGYSDIRPQPRWSIFSLDPETGEVADLGAPVPSGYGASVRWSSGDAQIVLERWSGANASREIWTADPEGMTARQLTDNAFDDLSPAWSPDGTHIAFVSDRNDPLAHQSGHAPIWDLYVMNADGSDAARLTHCGDDCGGNGVLSPSWSPDGSRLAFAMSKRRGPSDLYFQTDLYVVNADGSGLDQITQTPGQEQDPAWSPDGTRIAFSRHVDGQLDVFTVSVDGKGEVRLTDDPANDYSPAWSPDGRRIVFSSARNWDEAGNRLFEGDPGNAELYMMNTDGSDQTRLTNDPAWDGTASWLEVGSTTPSVHPSPSTTIGTCEFEVGDVVHRGGGGAAVPPPGQGVVGYFDGVTESGSIQITTSLDGIVTIVTELGGETQTVESCVLP
jgi:Tol biopolymer transport system component